MEETQETLEEGLRQEIQKLCHGRRDLGERDRFIESFTALITISDSRSNYSNARNRLRKAREIWEALGFLLCQTFVQKGLDQERADACLYQALYDSACRYVATMDQPGYGKKLLGLITIKEKERDRRSAQDVWASVNGAEFLWKDTVPEFDHAFLVYQKALYEAYRAHDEEADLRLRHEILSHK
ncbi:MAG: hypothetical protein PUE94_04390 [Lachnospiraceae bacterium]|nr:hypothetical protein [Lachnospiraceae bacterium]